MKRVLSFLLAVPAGIIVASESTGLEGFGVQLAALGVILLVLIWNRKELKNEN